MPADPQQMSRWLRELQLNGFVIFRNFLPVELVDGMRRQIMPILQDEYRMALAGESHSLRMPGRISLDIGHYAKLLGGELGDPRYRGHPVIEALVERVFEPRGGWERGWTQVECVWKGSTHMGWHTDIKEDRVGEPVVPGRPIRLTYNIPLVDFTWANGAMELIPGSHLLPHGFEGGLTTDLDVYPLSLRLRRGDALLRDSNTLHRGTPNLTDEPRPMLDQTYKALGRPGS